MKALSKAVGALCAVFALALSASAAKTYTWTAEGNAIGSAAYVKIFDDVGAFTGRLRLVGFSTADGEYTVTSNRLHVAATGGMAYGLPADAYVHQLSAGARFDGTTTKSIRVQLAQPAGSNALYARITAIATAAGDHMKKPDLRVAIKDDKTVAGTILESADDLAANAVTKIVVGVANDTIAYWPFGENGFRDVSGNGHNLEGVNVTASDAAYMSLNDGRTDQYLKTASALDLSAENAVTFECWWRRTTAYSTSNQYPMLMASEKVGANDLGGFFLGQYANAGVIRTQYRSAASAWQLDFTDNNDTMFAGGILNDGMWHHVAYVVDRTEPTQTKQCRLYVDGVEVANAGTAGTQPATVAALFNDYFTIGGGTGYSTAANTAWTGYIDDVRISRGVVEPEDFLKYPTVGKKMRADDGKLPVVAYWPFGGKRGRDATGNGYDLTMDDKVPMLSGTPNTTWGNRGNFNNFYLDSFPFSAFSKVGMTLECFVKTDSGSTSAGNILTLTSKYYDNPGAFRFGYDANFKVAGVTFRLPTSGKYASSKTTEAAFGALNDSRWRHFAVVYNPANSGAGIVTFYVDGVAAPCTSDVADQAAFALKDAILYFSRVAKDSSPFYGQFDDVRITAGVLTPDQFLPSRSSGSTVALYRLDNRSLEDASGNGHDLTFEKGTGSQATFEANSTFSSAGVGLVLNNGASNQRFHTSTPIDFSSSKAMTVEFDYNRWYGPPGPYALAASEDVSCAGAFVVDRTGSNDKYRGQFRSVADSSSYASALEASGHGTGTAVDGRYRVRYSVDANVSPMNFTLFVDGTTTTGTAAGTIDNLGCQKLYFGNSPSYQNTSYFKGVYYRIAISDVALDPADYVLDNLIDPEESRTLAYWNFKGFGGLTVPSGSKTSAGGLLLNGSNYATTTNLTFSTLTQATIECFVNFGATPASGTVFSLGSGAGSFAVSSDAEAGTLAGTFIPYNHLAASNGGVAALDPLAGRKDWHHVALVIDRTASGADAVKFYVDYERAMPAGRAWDKAATILDGALSIGTGFTGRIDDLRVSAGALEPSEFMHARTESVDGMLIIVR